MLPRLPPGAGMRLLDVFANDPAKAAAALVGMIASTLLLLKKEAIAAIAKLRSGDEWLAQVAKTCRAFPKRVAWVASNHGRKVARRLVNSD